ncbi:hypothetical protein CEP54_012669 [Fusarium duplospermum]|uniref:Uncharacterized protein n=1 Tax=Fusarium duplospermum TaxID=1325734 RepID=A0A428P7B5_9HYPO|nr:hypothetical protein CEP54_012669 [Fusarium duplospermum]
MPETWLSVVYRPAIERPTRPASRNQAKPLDIVGRTLLVLSINACRDGPELLNRTRVLMARSGDFMRERRSTLHLEDSSTQESGITTTTPEPRHRIRKRKSANEAYRGQAGHQGMIVDEGRHDS